MSLEQWWSTRIQYWPGTVWGILETGNYHFLLWRCLHILRNKTNDLTETLTSLLAVIKYFYKERYAEETTQAVKSLGSLSWRFILNFTRLVHQISVIHRNRATVYLKFPFRKQNWHLLHLLMLLETARQTAWKPFPVSASSDVKVIRIEFPDERIRGGTLDPQKVPSSGDFDWKQRLSCKIIAKFI